MHKEIHLKHDRTADDCHIHKKERHEVQWVNRTDADHVIVFDSQRGSPFAESRFVVPSGGQVNSGPIVTEETGTFEYSVKLAADENGPAGDPRIIIH